MPRAKAYGYIACLISMAAGIVFFCNAFFGSCKPTIGDTGIISACQFYSVSIPIGLVTLGILGAGFWIGWTILTIKVVPPMPEIAEGRDYSKLKAVFLCFAALALGLLFIYGVYLRSYWALALPAAVITLVILGMIFWVGIAIVTTRKTLPEKNENKQG
ncbi:MAG: hypothetical protein MUC95_01635 [Spirochaetes bacterium]|jgi:uncharacterized protein with PQ loop repeat|nr:hypothetical protein [Spirochaetota bacterium]